MLVRNRRAIMSKKIKCKECGYKKPLQTEQELLEYLNNEEVGSND
jgi:hypothetical protein